MKGLACAIRPCTLPRWLGALNITAAGGETGGDGGAIYTGLNSTTVFERRLVMRFNVGASGGGLYNLGTTTLETAGYIRGNDALVRNEPATVPAVDIEKARRRLCSGVALVLVI